MYIYICNKCIFLVALISKFKDEPLLRSLRPRQLWCQQLDRWLHFCRHAGEQLPREPGDGCHDPKVWSGHDAKPWPDPVGREFPGLWPIPQCGRMAVLASHTGPGHRTHLHLHQHTPGTDLHRGGGVPSRHGAAGDLWQRGRDCWTIAGWDALSIWRLFLALHHQCRFAPAFRCCLFDFSALQGGVEGHQGGWSQLGGRFRRLQVPRVHGVHGNDLFCGHAASAAAEWYLHPVPGGLGCFRTTAGRLGASFISIFYWFDSIVLPRHAPISFI